MPKPSLYNIFSKLVKHPKFKSHIGLRSTLPTANKEKIYDTVAKSWIKTTSSSNYNVFTNELPKLVKDEFFKVPMNFSGKSDHYKYLALKDENLDNVELDTILKDFAKAIVTEVRKQDKNENMSKNNSSGNNSLLSNTKRFHSSRSNDSNENIFVDLERESKEIEHKICPDTIKKGNIKRADKEFSMLWNNSNSIAAFNKHVVQNYYKSKDNNDTQKRTFSSRVKYPDLWYKDEIQKHCEPGSEHYKEIEKKIQRSFNQNKDTSSAKPFCALVKEIGGYMLDIMNQKDNDIANKCLRECVDTIGDKAFSASYPRDDTKKFQTYFFIRVAAEFAWAAADFQKYMEMYMEKYQRECEYSVTKSAIDERVVGLSRILKELYPPYNVDQSEPADILQNMDIDSMTAASKGV